MEGKCRAMEVEGTLFREMLRRDFRTGMSFFVLLGSCMGREGKFAFCGMAGTDAELQFSAKTSPFIAELPDRSFGCKFTFYIF